MIGSARTSMAIGGVPNSDDITAASLVESAGAPKMSATAICRFGQNLRPRFNEYNQSPFPQPRRRLIKPSGIVIALALWKCRLLSRSHKHYPDMDAGEKKLSR